jgi:hypothetical protein
LISLTQKFARHLPHAIQFQSFQHFQPFQKPTLSLFEGACRELAEGFNRFAPFKAFVTTNTERIAGYRLP